MNRRSLLPALATLPILAGCAALQADATNISTDIGLTASDVALLYGIVKGIAEVAELAEPGLAPAINLALNAMVTPMANIEAGISTAADIAAVVTQAASLTITASPAIKVIAATATAVTAASPT